MSNKKVISMGFKIPKGNSLWQCDFCKYKHKSYNNVRIHEKTCDEIHLFVAEINRNHNSYRVLDVNNRTHYKGTKKGCEDFIAKQ